MENFFRSPYMTLTMDRFSSGIYLLEVQIGDKRFWQKIVKE
ncbi:MAG: T9SS type A sorting domain-containing protein [Bacteroidota bacterium]